MKIESHIKDFVATVSLEGTLNVLGATKVDEELKQLIKAGSRKIELDMSKVDYISSAGLRALTGNMKSLHEIGGSLRIIEASERVMNFLEMTGVFDLLMSSGAVKPKIPLSVERFESSTIETYTADSNASLSLLNIISQSGEVIEFPETIIAIGSGAFVDDGDLGKLLSGIFLAAGGTAVMKPLEPGSCLDFFDYAHAYIPKLKAEESIVLEGTFADQSSISAGAGSPLNLWRLLQKTLSSRRNLRTGFVLIAECAQIQGKLGSGDVSDTAEYKDVNVLVCGLVSMASDDQVKMLRPVMGIENLCIAAHFAVFNLHPLRMGHAKLEESVGSLYNNRPHDVLVLNTGYPSHEIRCGLLWTSPVI